MTGFELRTSGIGSDRSTNCATTTAQCLFYCAKQNVVKILEKKLTQNGAKESESKYGDEWKNDQTEDHVRPRLDDLGGWQEPGKTFMNCPPVRT